MGFGGYHTLWMFQHNYNGDIQYRFYDKHYIYSVVTFHILTIGNINFIKLTMIFIPIVLNKIEY